MSVVEGRGGFRGRHAVSDLDFGGDRDGILPWGPWYTMTLFILCVDSSVRSTTCADAGEPARQDPLEGRAQVW